MQQQPGEVSRESQATAEPLPLAFAGCLGSIRKTKEGRGNNGLIRMFVAFVLQKVKWKRIAGVIYWSKQSQGRKILY